MAEKNSKQRLGGFRKLKELETGAASNGPELFEGIKLSRICNKRQEAERGWKSFSRTIRQHYCSSV
jgi:hypothetical protein